MPSCSLNLNLLDKQHAIDKSHCSLEGQWLTFWPAGVTSQAMLMYGIASLASCSAAAAASCISSRACHGTSSALHIRPLSSDVIAWAHDKSDEH